jgi:thiol:disulfide interchange protein DsbA
MRNALFIGIALSLLAACGQEEPAQPAVEEPVAAVEETVVEDAVEATEAVEETEATVVEESAAEPEADEQAIVLAQADVPAVTREWQFEEGKHYARLVPTQPTLGGADKIEVAEFFWYGCPHCYTFEPAINGWVEERKPANVRFVRIPAMWNGLLVMHAQLFYTEEILVRNGTITDAEGFRNAVFEEYPVKKNSRAPGARSRSTRSCASLMILLAATALRACRLSLLTANTARVLPKSAATSSGLSSSTN